MFPGSVVMIVTQNAVIANLARKTQPLGLILGYKVLKVRSIIAT